jgi:hypothetical protein
MFAKPYKVNYLCHYDYKKTIYSEVYLSISIDIGNYVVNPAVTSNYSKVPEYEADKLVLKSFTRCFDISMIVKFKSSN